MYFARLIFAQAILSENILISKNSRFMVVYYGIDNDYGHIPAAACLFYEIIIRYKFPNEINREIKSIIGTKQ